MDPAQKKGIVPIWKNSYYLDYNQHFRPNNQSLVSSLSVLPLGVDSVLPSESDSSSATSYSAFVSKSSCSSFLVVVADEAFEVEDADVVDVVVDGEVVVVDAEEAVVDDEGVVE